MTLEAICNLIIVVGSAYFMIGKIINSFAKPTSKIKQKQKEKYKQQIRETLNEIVPDYLYQHDLETRDRYLNDRLAYLKEIKKAVLEDIDDTLQEIRSLNIQQNKDINTLNDNINKLNNSSRDILRQKIMAIYHANKKAKMMTIYDQEALNELYKDYKAQQGNSYIDKYYNRMQTWEIVDEQNLYE